MYPDIARNPHPLSAAHAPYTVYAVTDGVWLIEDGTDTKSCIYVVEGSKSAVVIDTGSPCGGDLFALVRELTALPWTLLITHGHPDHAAFLDQTDAFYMSSKDLPLLEGFYPDGALPRSRHRPIDESTTFDLGGIRIHVIETPGHTPGSVMFTDPAHGLVFAGDAFGSGTGVWMQVPGAAPMSTYEKSALHAIDRMNFLFSGQDYAMLGGHLYQSFIGTGEFRPNPLCRALLEDMATLCRQCVDGTVRLIPPTEGDRAFSDEPVLRALYGRASAVCLRSNFH